MSKVKCNDNTTVNVRQSVTGSWVGERSGWFGPVAETSGRTESDVMKSVSANHGGIKSVK